MQPSGDPATENEKEKEKAPPKVPLFKLFSFADLYDCVLMILGSIGACIHGASVPIFFIFFGRLINIIGLAYLYPKQASHKVAKVLYFYLFILPFYCDVAQIFEILKSREFEILRLVTSS